MSDPVTDLVSAGDAYATFLEGLSEEEYRRRPGSEDWSNVEMAGHVAEAPLTFARVAVELSRQPGLRMGRQLEDPVRLAALTTMASKGPAEAANIVREKIGEAAEVLKGVAPDAWEVRGEHVLFGEMSVRQLVNDRIIAHVRAHLEQARQAAGGAR